MRSARLLGILATAIFLSACSTTPVPPERAPLVPVSRIYYRPAKSEHPATVIFVRDAGLVGSGVYHHIAINGEKAVSLDVGEKAVLQLDAGEYVFELTQTDPFGLFNPYTLDQQLAPGKTYHYRTTLDSSPPPRIQRVIGSAR